MAHFQDQNDSHHLRWLFDNHLFAKFPHTLRGNLSDFPNRFTMPHIRMTHTYLRLLSGIRALGNVVSKQTSKVRRCSARFVGKASVASTIVILLFLFLGRSSFAQVPSVIAPSSPQFGRSHFPEVMVHVNAGRIISHIGPYFYGLNVARWDEDLFPGPSRDMLLDCDRDAIRKVKEAGFTVLKYPGGNDADHYIWNSPDNSAGDMNTDEYAAFLRTIGAQGFITVNFNESPRLAADWVKYCNVYHHYDIKYWEVGDEQWGAWASGHTTPEKYAARFIEFAKAMKAVDPTIEVAADVMPSANPKDWTCRVLKAAGNYIDFVTFSYYPLTNKHANADSLFASLPMYRRDYEAIRKALQEELPAEKADTMWIADVGYNSISGRPGPFSMSTANALWLADLVGTMAELGEKVSCYWALHNSYPPGGGDYGLLSEDGKDTPRNNYYIFSMYTHLFGKSVIETSSSDSSLPVYSSLIGNDTLAIILINKNSHSSRTAGISLNDFQPEDSAGVWIFNATHKLDRLADLRNVGQTFRQEVPPYSIVVLHLLRKGTVFPPRNLALHARATASSYARNGPNYGPGSAVDGRMYTRWASAALWGEDKGLDRQWFEVDLGKPYEIDSIAIYWADGHGVKYKIEVSVDGKKWATIYSESEGQRGLKSILFKPAEARFVRISGTKGSPAISSYSVYEFEVFDSKPN